MDAYEVLAADRVVAVVRAERVADAAELAAALADSGIRCVEFTFTIPDVLVAIEAAADSGAVVGAGTVVDSDQARAAVAAGARFLVSPACIAAIAEAAAAEGVPAFLGAYTPTEAFAAHRAGAAAVKLFPAGPGGPDYVRHLRGPFPELALIPSGGIDETNAREFLAAGAVAVYAGSSLAPPELVAQGAHDEISRRARSFVASLS